MKERKQVTIGIHRDKYDSLIQKKAALEMAIGRRVDWGEFFLTLASQRSIEEIAFGIRYLEMLGKSDVAIDFKAITSQITKQDVEEVMGKAANKIISELKKHIDSRTGKLAGEGDEETQPKTYMSRPLEA